MGSIIVVGLLVWGIVALVKKLSRSPSNSESSKASAAPQSPPLPGKAATQSVSSPSVRPPPPLPELSASELARKALDALAAVNAPPERIRELWRAGQFEPLNLAEKALKKGFEHDSCDEAANEAVIKVSTYLILTMHKLEDYESADEICTQAQCHAEPDREFCEALVTTFMMFDQKVVVPLAGQVDELIPLTGQASDAERLALSERALERATRSLTGIVLSIGHTTHFETFERYEWAARLNPNNGDAWYRSAMHLFLNTRGQLEDGNPDPEWARNALMSAKRNAERASILIPENKDVWNLIEAIDSQIAQC